MRWKTEVGWVKVWQIFLNALPEALGGIFAAIILTLMPYFYAWLKNQPVKRLWVAGSILASLIIFGYLIKNGLPPIPESPTNIPTLEIHETVTPIATISPTPVSAFCNWGQIRIQDTENQGVPFYSTPSKVSSPIQSYLNDGEVFEVLGCSDDLLWWYLRNESGAGWVEGIYVVRIN